MAWVRSAAAGQDGSRTSPMPRRYCSTSRTFTNRRLVVDAATSTTPRYLRRPSSTATVPPPLGTTHRGEAEDTSGTPGTAAGGGKGNGAGGASGEGTGAT